MCANTRTNSAIERTNAANGSQSSTRNGKSLDQIYQCTLAEAYAFIMGANEHYGRKAVCVLVYQTVTYVRAYASEGDAASRITMSLIKRANRIAGGKCWNSTAKRYEIPAAAWAAAKAAAESTPAPAPAPDPTPAPTGDGGNTATDGHKAAMTPAEAYAYIQARLAYDGKPQIEVVDEKKQPIVLKPAQGVSANKWGYVKLLICRATKALGGTLNEDKNIVIARKAWNAGKKGSTTPVTDGAGNKPAQQPTEQKPIQQPAEQKPIQQPASPAPADGIEQRFAAIEANIAGLTALVTKLVEREAAAQMTTGDTTPQQRSRQTGRTNSIAK